MRTSSPLIFVGCLFLLLILIIVFKVYFVLFKLFFHNLIIVGARHLGASAARTAFTSAGKQKHGVQYARANARSIVYF